MEKPASGRYPHKGHGKLRTEGAIWARILIFYFFAFKRQPLHQIKTNEAVASYYSVSSNAYEPLHVLIDTTKHTHQAPCIL